MANEFYTTMQTKAFEAQLRQLPESVMTLLPFATNEGTKVGEEAYFNQIGSMKARKGKVRFGDHEKDQATYKRRRVTPDFAYLATELDCKDQVESLVDPRSKLAMTVKNALSRQMGQDAIGALFGTAYTGKAGATTEAFNTSDVIGVQVGGSSANVGLNATKLNMAIRKIQDKGFNLNDPMNQLTLVMAPQQSVDCKVDTKLANFDYMNGKILSGINIPNGFMGISNVITDPACPFADATGLNINAVWDDAGIAQDLTGNPDLRMAFLFVKSALSYAMWENPMVRVEELQAQHYDWQLYSRVQYGMTRMYAEGSVVGMVCDQSP